MSTRRIVQSTKAPQAIGPYSQAVVAGGFVFASGQIALDPQTGERVGGGDVATETDRVLQNLAAVLEAAGTDLAHVVRCDVFLRDLGDFDRMNEAYARHFPAAAPARVTVEASKLPRDVRVEIAAIAVLA